MVYFKMNVITYENLGPDNKFDYNKIKETNEVILNSDFITSLRKLKYHNRRQDYVRFIVIVSYNSKSDLGTFYLSEVDYNTLQNEINNNLTIVNINIP